MTVNQFCRKYDVPINLVYQASFKTETRKNDPYYIHDIPEKELATEVYKTLQKRVRNCKETLDKYSAALERVKHAMV